MDRFLLRSRREALGLTALQMANQARCPVETVVHTEFGFPDLFGEEIRRRLAEAYRLAPERFNRLVRHAEARLARHLVRQRRPLRRRPALPRERFGTEPSEDG